jgi:hypothetical protein
MNDTHVTMATPSICRCRLNHCEAASPATENNLKKIFVIVFYRWLQFLPHQKSLLVDSVPVSSHSRAGIALRPWAHECWIDHSRFLRNERRLATDWPSLIAWLLWNKEQFHEYWGQHWQVTSARDFAVCSYQAQSHSFCMKYTPRCLSIIILNFVVEKRKRQKDKKEPGQAVTCYAYCTNNAK